MLQGGGEVTECRAPLIGHGGQLRHAADSVVLGAVGDQGDHRLGGLVLGAVLVTADVGR